MSKNLSENDNRNNKKEKLNNIRNIKKDNVLKFIELLKQKNDEALKKNKEERFLKKKISQETKRKLKEEKKEKALINRQKRNFLANEIELKRKEKKTRLHSFINSLREANKKKEQSVLLAKQQLLLSEQKKKEEQQKAQEEQKKVLLLALKAKREEKEKKHQEEIKQKEQKQQILLAEQKKKEEQQVSDKLKEEQEHQRKQKEKREAILLARKTKKEQLISFINSLREANKKKEQSVLLAKQQLLLSEQKKKEEQQKAQEEQKKALLLALKDKREKLKKTKENKILERQIKTKTLQLTILAGTLQQNISQQVAAISNQISSIVKKAIRTPIPKIKRPKIKKPAGIVQKPVFSLFPLLFKGKKSAQAIMPTSIASKKYVEPFMLVPFLRKNLFKIFTLILFLGILGEIGFYSATFKSPTNIFKKKYGTTVSSQQQQPQFVKQIKPKIKKEKVSVKIAQINIEGKRNPFSPEVLTMQVLKRPQFTGITLAYQPEVISIEKYPSIVSISSGPTYKKPVEVSSILKPEKPSLPSLPSLPSFTSPEGISKPQVSTLMVPPEIKNPFVYRGSMIINGIEYFFLEADNRTYRGSIGDTIKGFRIIKKQDNKIYLSKNGRIIELSTQ